MATTFPDDDRLMALIEQVMRLPSAERADFLRLSAGSDPELFKTALNYLAWEERMGRFLLDPLAFPLQAADPAERPFAPGQIILRRFHIIREVAEGGMGIVWEAFDEKKSIRVALKCAKPGFARHLPPEVRNASEITHPNVCRIYDIHTASTPAGDVDFICMEFLEGETLASRIARHPLPKADRRSIARQICAGLAEAHRHDLIHGDLKPNNVILTVEPDGSMRAVLTDFGLAQVASTSRSPFGGTVAYMAPELWKGAQPSISTDIYALGVLLWEICSGRLPQDLGIDSKTIAIGEHPVWQPPPGRGKWSRVIARCLRPDPATRFANVEAVSQALGPSRALRLGLSTVLLATLTTAAVIVGTRVPPPPAEHVRLALLPFTTNPMDTARADRLLHTTVHELGQLQGNHHTSYQFKTDRNPTNATHTLRANIRQDGASSRVYAYIRDLRSGTDIREWSDEYPNSELANVSSALAGFVSETFHIPPSNTGSTISVTAQNHYKQGLAALRRDKTVEHAMRYFEQALLDDPDSAVLYASLAESQWYEYSSSDDPKWLKRSQSSLHKASLRNPDLAPVHRLSGLFKAESGRYEQAITEYLRAIELDPNSGDAYRRLGQAYQQNQQSNEALAAFKAAVDIDPLQSRNRRSLGNFYFLRGQYREAIGQLQKALEYVPEDFSSSYLLGLAYQDLGQFDLAEKELRVSLASRQTSETLHSLGVLHIYQNREREAISLIRQSLAIGPEVSLHWLNLGIAYQRAGFDSQAQVAFRNGTELAQSELAANPRNALVRTHLANLCARRKDFSRAQSEIAQALQQAPNNVDVLFMAALAYEALGMRDQTLALLSKAPLSVIQDLNRWPDMADLHKDPRFIKLSTAYER